MAFLKENGGKALSGKLGGQVYRRTDGDTVVAAAPSPNDPQSPAQCAQRTRLMRVNWFWASLPLDSIARWRAYAASASPLPHPPRGAKTGRTPSGNEAFKRLATKYLIVHGGTTVPTEPPTSAFLGDGPRLSVAGTAQGVRFEASSPNSPGVVTELMLQRLPARHRLPKARDYRTMTFVAFAGEPTTVSCRPGAYACAFRYVCAETGQSTERAFLGVVEVGG